jgi:hypothetical protein
MAIVIQRVYSHGLDERSHEDAPWTRLFTRRWDGKKMRFPRAGNTIEQDENRIVGEVML